MSVAVETQAGGRGDTPGGLAGDSGQAALWGIRDRSWRRLWKMLTASVLAHAFLTPGPALLGLIAMLPALELSKPDDLIEVELTSIPLAPIQESPKPKAPDQNAEPPKTEPAPLKAPENPPEDKSQPKPAEPEEDPPTPQPEPTNEPAPGPTEAFGDPVALAGSAGEIADSNANVRLVLFNEVVRDHVLGERIGSLLRRTPQWSDFFGPSGIDPIRDVDRVLITGPQLRDSSQVVAVVQHGLGKERINKAFDSLVARQGSWIDKGAMLARGRADRADRIFAAPNEHVVVVGPPQLEAQLRTLSSKTHFPKNAGDVAVTAYLITPYRVALGTGIQLPKSIKWARLDLRPLPDGGAILKVRAEDADAEQARTNAVLIQTLIEQATSLDLGKMGGLGSFASLAFGVKKKKYLKSVKFESADSMIDGTIEVTPAQLLMAVDLLDAFLPPADAPDKGAAPAPGLRETEPDLEEETEATPSPAKQAPPLDPPPDTPAQSPETPPSE